MPNGLNIWVAVITIICAYSSILLLLPKVVVLIRRIIPGLSDRITKLVQVSLVIIIGFGIGHLMRKEAVIVPGHWNSIISRQYDFENILGLHGWKIMDGRNGHLEDTIYDWTRTITNDIAFGGKSSLQIKGKIQVQPYKPTPFWIVWDLTTSIQPYPIQDPRLKLITGKMLISEDPSYQISWMQVCIISDKFGWSEGVRFSVEKGRWNSFAIDLQKVQFIDSVTKKVKMVGLGGSAITSLVIQGAIIGEQPSSIEYVFNIDDIEIYYGSDVTPYPTMDFPQQTALALTELTIPTHTLIPSEKPTQIPTQTPTPSPKPTLTPTLTLFSTPMPPTVPYSLPITTLTQSTIPTFSKTRINLSPELYLDENSSLKNLQGLRNSDVMDHFSNECGSGFRYSYGSEEWVVAMTSTFILPFNKSNTPIETLDNDDRGLHQLFLQIWKDKNLIYFVPIDKNVYFLKKLIRYEDHWIFWYMNDYGNKGRIVQDGILLNDLNHYDNAFSLFLLDGKPLFFFQRGSQFGVSFNNKEILLPYSNIAYSPICCESGGRNNPQGTSSMIGFYYLTADNWYKYVEIGLR